MYLLFCVSLHYLTPKLLAMWSKRPFLRIFILYAVGIVISAYYPVGNVIAPILLVSIILLLLLTAGSFKLKNESQYRSYIHRNYLIGLAIILSGAYSLFQCNNINMGEEKTIKGNFIANIVSLTKKPGKSTRAVAYIKSHDNDSLDEFKAILYFENPDPNLKYGDVIIFKSNLSPVSPPKNPYEFNYKEYLLKQSITHSGFIKNNSWHLAGYKNISTIKAYTFKLKHQIIEILRNSNLDDSEFSIASAILLGHDDYMDNTLKEKYMDSGSMHILCVSGLHVGIIYLVINFLLGFMNNIRKLQPIKSMLIILFIWSYAAITGFSPSVQRASLMISIFIIGKQINKKSDSYNNLAIAGFLILLTDPQLLFNPGFQLSFGAVFSIITFYTPLYNTIKLNNKFIDKIWSITILSFSAQIGTFPISIYYFHYFPTWFWISNLFTFPLSFLIVISGILTIALGWVPYLGDILELILKFSIKALNYLINWVVNIPYSIIENIYFSMAMVICAYLLLAILYLILYYRKPVYLKYLLTSLIIIISLATYHKYNVLTQKRIIIYSNNKGSFIEGIIGDKQMILADSNVLKNKSIIKFNICNSRAVWSVSDSAISFNNKDRIFFNGFQKINNFILFDDKIIALDINNQKYHTSQAKLTINYQLIQIPYNRIYQTDCLLPQYIIITNRIPDNKSNEITQFYNDNGITVINVKKDGAWVSH